jgi:invasion protein IalB
VRFGLRRRRGDEPRRGRRQARRLGDTLRDADRPNITLVVIALKTADHKSRLLRVIAPLGVLIPTGLGLKLDQEDFGRMSFVRCLPNGCVAEVVLEDKVLDKMKTAQTMTLVLFQTPEEGIGVPASLAGFKDGFDQLP